VVTLNLGLQWEAPCFNQLVGQAGSLEGLELLPEVWGLCQSQERSVRIPV
jgi:hypothetical protein